MTGLPHMPRRYVFWQPIPSMHQMPFLEALPEAADADVVCVHAEDVPADRIALGWSQPTGAGIKLLGAREAESSRLFDTQQFDTLHIFSGLHCHPFVSAMFRKAVARHATSGLISEAHDGHGIRGAVRRLRSSIDAARYAKKLPLILAMGSLGVDWYRTAGFRHEAVFPFAYVAATAAVKHVPPMGEAPPFLIAFVGQVIHRKGVDLLLQALETVADLPWRFEVAGAGPLESSLRARADSAGFAGRITWRGSLPNREIGGLLASCDLLVLPSRFDGWGVVVNEALAAGTPVVCSDACGAADLLATTTMGSVFRSGSAAALSRAIRERIVAGPPNADARCSIRSHAKHFSPHSIARYFVDVVRSVREQTAPPPVPWTIVAAIG